jgi:hypothetical protein
MGSDGKLIKADKVIIDSTGVYEKKTDKNKLKELEEKERKNEKERQEIERERQKIQRQGTDSNSTGYNKDRSKESELTSLNLFTPIII